MSRSQHEQMRDAINDIELALNGIEIDRLCQQWDGAADTVMVKVSLGDLRRLNQAFPALNRIINDPAFEKAMSDAEWYETYQAMVDAVNEGRP